MILNDLLKIQSNIGSPPMGRHSTGLKISLFICFFLICQQIKPLSKFFPQAISYGPACPQQFPSNLQNKTEVTTTSIMEKALRTLKTLVKQMI